MKNKYFHQLQSIFNSRITINTVIRELKDNGTKEKELSDRLNKVQNELFEIYNEMREI